ncbi:MAG: radical SAM protein [Gammaproteobacteria bacterium]|nr:radical SAM protein [Gammaproteobacteria bacterium]
MRIVAQNYVVYFIDDIPIPFSRMKWKDLAGKPYIWHVVERLKRCKRIDEVILFTQDTPENKGVIGLAQKWNLNLRYLGKPHNWDSTLKWYESLDADIVIYPYLFSPLVDPETLDFLIDYFIKKDLDYLESKEWSNFFVSKSNIWLKLYGIEKDFDKIIWSWTNIIKERKDLFKSETFGKLDEIEFLGKNPLRWYPHLRKVYNRFYTPGEIIDSKEVLSLYREDPEWFEIFSQDQIEIEVTNDCNLKCIMCPRTSNMNREIGYMDFDLFKKIVDETEVSSIHFSGLGEPMLHPQVKDMFAYAKEKGLEVGLWTNGLSLDEGFSKQIIEREFVDYIIVGLDAATKEIYAKVKGVDVFDKAVENINGFLRLKKEKVAGMEKDTPGWWAKAKPIVGIQILKMKENDAEIEPFMDKWHFQDKLRKMLNWKQKMEEVAKQLKPLGEELDRIKDRLDWKEPAKGEISDVKKPKEVIGAEAKLSAKSQELMEPLNELYWKTFYEKFLPVEHAIIGHFNNFCGQIEDRSTIDVTPLKRFPCQQLKAGLSVLWNGDIVLCRQDLNGKYSSGNLREQSLSEILEDERLKEVWQAHKKGEYGKLPLCKDCKEWYYNLYA